MAVPLELPTFLFTDILEVSGVEEGGREEDGRRSVYWELERWGNYVADLAKP